MTYILILIATFLLMGLNWKLLDIPGFFYYSSVRPCLLLIFKERLSKVEDVYYWEIVGAVGTMAHLSLLPAYIISFDLLSISPIGLRWVSFFLINYIWWLFYSYRKVKEHTAETPALCPRNRLGISSET
ncbi:hypothetical protein [Hazenella coriacea]|uniref:hypothetical protein n=1 Tax=Hazenella coriacea TaxID=1179467 RepID=UPI0010509E89|nr:hypothetical protein [Hazenella coriacea]